MLVLSRKLGQRFQVGHEIRVTIVRIDRNAVRIGIEAPDGTPIYREEIAPAAASFGLDGFDDADRSLESAA